MTSHWIESIKFDENGLVPVVVTDSATGQVLMLAYATSEALGLCVSTKEAWFYSRSRQTLWKKGETSKNTMQVLSILVDCDNDAVWYRVRPSGPACHTGATSCFFRKTEIDDAEQACDVLGVLEATIQHRKQQRPKDSYVSKMLDLGTPEIARKIGEEAVETLMAAVCEDGSRLVSETADLWFHCMLLLASRDLSFRDVLAELASRHKPNLGDADVR